MIRGLHSFRECFQGYESNYIIIGGAACDLLMSDFDMEFRATKDLDLVLILEVLTVEFGRKFWDYIWKQDMNIETKVVVRVNFIDFLNLKTTLFRL